MSGVREQARETPGGTEESAEPERADAENSGLPGGRDEVAEEIEKIKNILARPVETWSVDDLRTIMQSETYWSFWNPEHEDVHLLVDRWHELFHRDGQPRRAARGKADPVQPVRACQIGSRIRVRAHMRVGVIPVRAHERARRK